MECAIGGSNFGNWELDAARPSEEKLTVYHTGDDGGVMCCGTPEIRSAQQLKVKAFDWDTMKYVTPAGKSSFSMIGDTNFGIGQENNIVVMKGRDLAPAVTGITEYDVAIKLNGAIGQTSQRYDYATVAQPPEVARQSCKLAMPKDSGQQILVAAAAAAWPVKAEAQNQFVWLGGRWKNNRWEWDDGIPITGYTNWAAGQPDTTSSTVGTGAWLCMDRYTGEWHDCYGPPGALTPLGAMCEIEASTAKSPTWIHTPTTIEDGEFNKIVWDSKYKIIRRVCLSCSNSHKDIYYKRITMLDTFNYAEIMFNTWWRSNNENRVDFNLFSTLEEALADNGHSGTCWRYVNYDNAGVAFPYNAGPIGAVESQWNSRTRGGKAAEFYVLDDAGNRDRTKNSLVHYYDFDGTANDIVGGAHGFLHGGATFGSNGGDSYLELSGDMQYLTLPAEKIADTMMRLHGYTITMTIEPAAAKTTYLFDFSSNNLRDRM
jgi:hypothetical protein